MKQIKNVFHISDENWIFDLCFTLGIAAGFVCVLVCFNSKQQTDIVSHAIASIFVGAYIGFIVFAILLFIAATINEVVNWIIERHKKK